MFSGFLLLCLASLCYAEYQLYLLDPSDYPMAQCLDGTPGGYYVELAEDGNTDNVQIYFEGGGWCYEWDDCWERAQGALGSSKAWPQTQPSLGGLVGSNCSLNPTFCQFNRIWLNYCDGNSFTGYRASPVSVRGQNLYFRGFYILQAILADLRTNPATAFWNTATEVMVTGASAGGLASFLHGDYVISNLASRKVQVAGIVPISGYFLPADNLQSVPVYYDEIYGSFNMSSNLPGLPPACLLQHQTEPWLCNFAPWIYPTIKNPIYVLNSMMDLWQVICILTAVPVPQTSTHNGNCGALWSGQPNCLGGTLGNCTSAQISELNAYAALFKEFIGDSPQPGNGGFFTSCITHCEAQDSSCFFNLEVGGVTISDAVTSWWTGLRADRFSASPYIFDCDVLTVGGIQNCNPGCQSFCS